MSTEHATLFLVAVVLAIAAGAVAGGSDGLAECQRDGHSYAYCYQLLYGAR